MAMQLVDSHCHLDSPRISDPERLRMMHHAAAAGVHCIVIPGVTPATWSRLLELVRAPAAGLELHACAGIHPQALPDLDDSSVAHALDRLERFQGQGLVAIGETGLDRPTSRVPGGELERQVEVLEAHLDIAARQGLPVVLHCLRCHDTLRKVLERRGGHPPGIVLHSFSGSPDMVRPYLEFGAWFSIAGPITYPNARRPLATARAIPLERMLLETDAPDQTPAPHRGRLNEPAFLPAIAARVAEVLEIPLEVVAARTSRNARTCFGLDTGRPGTPADGKPTSRETTPGEVGS